MIKKNIIIWLFLSLTLLYAQTVNLKEGYNAVAFNKALTLEELQNQIGIDNLLSIQGTGENSTYKKSYHSSGEDFLNNFTEVQLGKAYWVRVDQPAVVEYTENNYTTTQTIELISGWNFIAPYSLLSFSEIENQLGVDNLLIIQGSNKTYKKLYADNNEDFLNTFNNFEENQGYWIKVQNSTSLLFNFDQNNSNTYEPDPLPVNLIADEAMNLDPNHPKFSNWSRTSNIQNGALQLITDDVYNSYTFPSDAPYWKPHHKYTLVWDMETIANAAEEGVRASIRILMLGANTHNFRNSAYNKVETKYAVLTTEDILRDNKSIWIKSYKMPANTTIKVSNIRLYDGTIELPKPILKEQNFAGTISMDKQGVFRRNGEVIFPINLYKQNTIITQGNRTVQQYIDQGITGVIVEAESENWNSAREESITKLVEGGMTTVSIPITNYLKNPNYAVGTDRFDDFTTIINNLKSTPEIWDGVAVLSIDNEFYVRNQQFKDSIAAIRALIPDKPIQMLNGNQGISSWYNDYIDITGTYIANDGLAMSGEEAAAQINELEAQRLNQELTVPATLIQINQGTRENFGAVLMSGVAVGGTKLEYWKDDVEDHGANDNRELDITQNPIWGQLPTVRMYLDKLCQVGVIETSPYSSFKITQTNDQYEFIKGRYDKNGKAYIFATNMHIDEGKTITFNQSYKGLSYAPSGNLKDILSGEIKGNIDLTGQTINITLSPHEWVILEVEAQ